VSNFSERHEGNPGGVSVGDDRVLVGAALGGLGSLVAAMALVGVRGQVDNQNVALLLVICIFVGAAVGGRAAGGASAIVAALAFDFFHTRPYNSLKITASSDIETTILLLLVGLAAGELGSRAHQVLSQRRASIRELQRLNRVASLAASGDTGEDLALEITAELIDAMQLRACWFERPPFLGDFSPMHSSGPGAGTVLFWAGGAFELPREGVQIPVIAASHIVGRFVLIPSAGVGVSHERRAIATALAGQLGVVLAHQGSPG
jgi:hypothetical protein